MASPMVRTSSGELDFLLEEVIRSLTLTQTQYQNAVEKYSAVGGWLSRPGSRAAALSPFIYPQGSMALRTTVRPIRALEYDLDLVCQMVAGRLSAMELYDLLYESLAESQVYRPRLEKKNRCVRIQFANDFHLDLIPGTLDPRRPLHAILVPDRARRNWTPSNPLGFAGWFHVRARGDVLTKAIAPLPPQTILERTTLGVAVQLMKRRRDVRFGDGELAPRSIVLTTLAAHAYRRESSVGDATLAILQYIERAIAMAWPRPLEVTNPTNPDERFSDAFTSESYEAFKSFIVVFRAEMEALLAASGTDLHRRLTEMFGSAPAAAAMRALGEKLQEKREHGLRFGAASGLAIVGERVDAGYRVPRNTFFGDH